jgi:hypothetical protein
LKLPRADKVRIEARKVRGYLLSPTHPVGRFKARVFAALGFNETTAEAFITEIRRIVKTVDFRKWLDGPVFEPLKDPSYFRRFFLDAGTIVWPNGADIAPENPVRGDRSSGEAVQQPDAADERHRAQTERRSPLTRRVELNRNRSTRDV